MRRVADYAACRVPLRRITFGDATIVVHAGTVASIKRIERRWIARGGNAAYTIRKADSGAYNCRRATGSASWSKHAWGAAVDLNWRSNPFGSRLVTDMPRWFVQLWLDEGWGWGGNWRGKKDAMHFSKFESEGGDGRLYVGDDAGTGPTEEDWFDMATKAELEALLQPIKDDIDQLKRAIGVGQDFAQRTNVLKALSQLLDRV
jgi:hypothetical protein